MESIITAIQTRLSSEVPTLKYIDEDWGQLDYYSPNPPVKWPCVLIDVQDAQWSNLGSLKQQGLLQLSIKVIDLRLSNSSHAAPKGQKNNSKSFYTLTQAIYKALHGWSNDKDLYSDLIRTAERRVKRDDGIKMHEMIFTTQFTDTTAVIVRSTTPKPTVTFELLE